MFNNAGSINFRGKKVKQIIRIKDNAILYQMDDNHLEFTFTKKQLYLRGLTGSNMIIDYGNGDIRETTGELIQYNYNTLEDETHIVKIYGVTGLGYESFKECYGLTDMTIPSTVTSIGRYCFTDCDHLENINIPSSITSLPRGCFSYCTRLLSIDIPSSIISIEGNCFYSCSSLAEINLNWTALEDIVSYQSNWITSANANLKFIIPEGTTDLYIEKGYPSDKLVEINDDETMDISVSVVYDNDNNNQDRNRPTEILISLTVSRETIKQATLTAVNNWTYTFSGLLMEDGFSYQIVPDRIDYYLPNTNRVNNEFIITETYIPPERTSANVQIEFDDVIPDYRPETITATLNNGMTSSLTQNNEWNVTITDLSSIINHESAVYDWTIPQIPHYEISQKTQGGSITRFVLRQLDNIPTSITLEKTDGKQVLSYADRTTLPVTEFCKLAATIVDANNNPLSNAYVDFYKNDELWMPDIPTDSDGQAIVTYYSEGVGDVEIYAKIGNLSSETYTVYDYLFVPKLDGADSITKWTDIPNNTSGGIFSSHGSFLTAGWSNEGLWELDFDVQCTSWRYIGLMPVCSAEINPFTDAKASSYAMTTWEGISYMKGMGFSSWDNADSMSKITDGNWHHITITKLSATKVKIVIDNTYTAIGNYSNLPNHSTLHIGSRDNPADRNNGGIVKYKNIIVKPKKPYST